VRGGLSELPEAPGEGPLRVCPALFAGQTLHGEIEGEDQSDGAPCGLAPNAAHGEAR
jgi:hypothetical protein